MTNIKNLGSEEAPKWYFVTTILVNGEELEIIPAFTDYSLKHKNFEKDKVFKAIDKSKLLPTVFTSVMQNHSMQRMFLYTITLVIK